MKRADRMYREMVLSGRSMGRRRRWPRWAEMVLCWVALAAMAAALCCAFCQALDDCGNLLTTFNGNPWECLQACTVEGMPFGVAVRAEEGDHD